MNIRKAFLKNLESQLKEWSGLIDRVQDSLQDTDASEKKQTRKQIYEIALQKDIIGEKLDNLKKDKDVSDFDWEKRRGAIESSLEKLGERVNNILSTI